MGFHGIYPLVNVNIKLWKITENHHATNGKTHVISTGPFSIISYVRHYQRVTIVGRISRTITNPMNHFVTLVRIRSIINHTLWQFNIAIENGP